MVDVLTFLFIFLIRMKKSFWLDNLEVSFMEKGRAHKASFQMGVDIYSACKWELIRHLDNTARVPVILFRL